MRNNSQGFCIEMPANASDNDWAEFQKIMNDVQTANVNEIKAIATKHKISEGAASDIWYLRTRSRWTQKKEDYLIYCAQNNLSLPDTMEDF